MVKPTDEFWEKLYEAANSVGLRKGKEHKPQPMVIYRAKGVFDNSPADDNRYVVEGGPCGFAWVTIKPATQSFVRWLKKNDIGRKSYYGGWDVPINEHGQSIERKIAHAKAMKDLLESANIKCYVGSRMD
jgi:hypothetical protein